MDTKREHRTHAEGSPRGNPYDLTYSPSGRLIGKSRNNNSVTLSASVDMAYGYCDDNQPHAVRRIFDDESHQLFDLRWDEAGNLGQVSMAKLGDMFEAGRFLFWTEDNRMHAAVDDRYYSYYAYDHSGERRLKLTGDNKLLDVNADFMATYTILNKPTLYPSAYMVLSNKGYTKHYYAGTERVAARLGGGGLDALYRIVGTDNTIQTKAGLLFDQSLEQVNNRLLPENDLNCIMQNVFAKEDFGHWIDGIPYQMQAGVEINHDQFKDMVNSMLDDNYHGQEKDVYFYHSDHLGSASWKKERFGKPFASERAEEARSGILHITTTYVQHLQYLPYGEPYINQRLSGYNERFTFTGKDPRKGWRIPLDEIKYNEQRDEEKEMSGGHFASERGEEPRSGMQYCSSLSFTNFGARYMDHELMTMWLSVDPMADKYPSISPYNYCMWNPVKLVDPDGNEAGIPPTRVRTGWFALRHPQIASAIGSCRPGEMNTNISTRSERFATRGSSYSSQGTIFRSNGCTEDPDPCSEIGAFRHTLWQATIASYYGRDIATQVGNAHEDNPNANLKARRFSSMAEADQVVDLLNNMLGRTIGEQNPNCPMNELAGKVLESFYKTGLYTGSLNEDGSWSVSRTKITKEQYDSYLNVLGGLDFNGFNSIEQANYRAKCERVNQAIQEAGRWIDNK